MQLHEAFELIEMYSVGQANRAIQNEGWQLLAIAPGANGLTYVLGRPETPPVQERVRSAREIEALAAVPTEMHDIT